RHRRGRLLPPDRRAGVRRLVGGGDLHEARAGAAGAAVGAAGPDGVAEPGSAGAAVPGEVAGRAPRGRGRAAGGAGRLRGRGALDGGGGGRLVAGERRAVRGAADATAHADQGDRPGKRRGGADRRVRERTRIILTTIGPSGNSCGEKI